MNRLAGLLAITLALSGTAGAAKDQDRQDRSVTGSWSLTVKGSGSHGDVAADLTLAQEGTKVTGRLSVHGREHDLEGEFVDRTLKLTIAHEHGGRQMTLSGVLKDDGKLSGSLSGPDGDLQWTAERK